MVCALSWQKLQGQALLDQIQSWEERGIVEASHANALRECIAHPEWFALSDRTTVLFGAASEAGPLTWLSKWKPISSQLTCRIPVSGARF